MLPWWEIKTQVSRWLFFIFMPIFPVAGWILQRYAAAFCECAIGPAVTSLYIVELIRLMFKTGPFAEIFIMRKDLVGERIENLWADLFQPAYIVTGVELLLMITRALIDLRWTYPGFDWSVMSSSVSEVSNVSTENVEEATKSESSNLPEYEDKNV